VRNDRLTRFLAVCLKIRLNSSGAKKGNEISFLENEISKIKINEMMILITCTMTMKR